jgi:DNA helicase II / ATP-dependent DNA helicase PcrA
MDLLNNLNDEQLKAVTHVDGPLLIVAGAGTGKTTVITRRLAFLMQQQLAQPQQILALTFTDKAASEMEERVDQLLPLGTYDLWISTFHSFCERILKLHALDIGVPNDFRLLDDVQQWIFVYQNFEKFQLDYYRPLGSPNKFIDALLNHFSKCKDEMITPEQYVEYAQKLRLNQDNPELFAGSDSDQITEIKRTEEVASAYHAYQKLLLDNACLDFGDLINYTLELFSKRPNILKRYQQQFKFIMVDEFQDTNVAQYQLIKLLLGNTDPHIKMATSNLVVVGDDDQSIYKFRGASVSNILKLREDYPGLKEITLVQNYRSTQAILDLAYHFIQANNPNRLEPQLGINKQLKSTTQEPGVIEVLEGKDLSEELDLVVKKIIELKQADEAVGWNEFAILVRANSAANEVLPRLDAALIPYTFLANRGLYRKRLIADLINYIRVLDNYHESSALYRVLSLPEFELDANDLSLITNYASKKALSLYEALQQVRTISGVSEDTSKKIEAVLSNVHKHTDMAKDKTAIETFVTIVHELGVSKSLEAETMENAENREYLEQFFKRIESFEEQHDDKSLHSFIQNLKLEMEAGSEGPIKFDPNLGPESLKVMTVHSAKGLEFRYVFIINLVDQRFPTRAKGDAIEIPEPLIKDILPVGDFHLQEERRLFYVALTRAKTHLYLSWGRDYGGAKMKKPSTFLQETHLVPSEKVSTATGKVVFTRTYSSNKKVVYKHLPTSFSFTEIGIFENCPMEYKFRFYLRLPMPGTPQLSFGRTVHRVLQYFAETYRQATSTNQQALFGDKVEASMPDFKVMEELYREYWLDEWYHSKKEKESYRQLGLTMLRSVYEDFVSRRPLVKYIEQEFELPLGDFIFEGKIDRVDALAGGVDIIDYKTNGVPKVKNKRDLDQLRIYQWAVQEALHEKVEQLQYWHLQDNAKVDDELATPEQIEKIKADILDTIQRIRHVITYDLFAEEHAKSKVHNCRFEEYL